LASQSISFTSVPPSGAVAAPGDGSGNPVTFSSGSSPVCSASGSTVTSNTVGSCVIDANQAVSAQYQASTQAGQTITGR
jgi:hypothetical protein